MTIEEMQAFQSRLDEARGLLHLLKSLKSGLKYLIEGECCALFFMKDATPIYYAEKANGQIKNMDWKTVCWTNHLPNINEELKQAVVDILGKRIAELEEKLAQI